MTEENFWARVDRCGDDECWPWLACAFSDGYGQVYVGEGSELAPGVLGLAHRVAYQFSVGKIPSGLELDHLCRNKICCNPRHLEAVTHRENLLRGKHPAARNVVKTHCVHGHEFTPENTYQRPSGGRECIACKFAFRAIHNPKRYARA